MSDGTYSDDSESDRTVSTDTLHRRQCDSARPVESSSLICLEEKNFRNTDARTDA